VGILDIKPLESADGWAALLGPGLLAMAAAALAALLTWAIVRRRRRLQAAGSEDGTDSGPGDFLSAEIAEAADDRQFYFALTACVRRHLAQQFRIHTAAATTSELLMQLSRQVSSQVAFQELARRLEDADRFRFGGLEAGPERRRQDLLFFQNFITSNCEGAGATDLYAGVGRASPQASS
jgi:hypothetical protein